MTSGNAKCRDWLVQPISVYRRMRIRPAAKSFLLRVLHMCRIALRYFCAQLSEIVVRI